MSLIAMVCPSDTGWRHTGVARRAPDQSGLQRGVVVQELQCLSTGRWSPTVQE